MLHVDDDRIARREDVDLRWRVEALSALLLESVEGRLSPRAAEYVMWRKACDLTRGEENRERAATYAEYAEFILRRVHQERSRARPVALEEKRRRLPATVLRPRAACGAYLRPRGVLGGPCLTCGHTQPEHAKVRS